MTDRYQLVRLGARNGMYYCKDTLTGSRTSLETKNKKEAKRLIFHKNEAAENPHARRKIGMAYLSTSDPKLATRTWDEVMEDVIKDKTGPTLKRWKTAIKDEAFDLIRKKVVVDTTSEEFMAVLRGGTVSTNVYLRRLQNHCIDMDWLPVRILPKKKFPKIEHKDQRAIIAEEHAKIIAREGNPERRDFYELCWFFGASQSDVAHLDAEDIDYERRCFVYDRLKTGNMGGMRIGDRAWKVIMRRPKSGPLFPYLMLVDPERKPFAQAISNASRISGRRSRSMTIQLLSWAECGVKVVPADVKMNFSVLPKFFDLNSGG